MSMKTNYYKNNKLQKCFKNCLIYKIFYFSLQNLNVSILEGTVHIDKIWFSLTLKKSKNSFLCCAVEISILIFSDKN